MNILVKITFLEMFLLIMTSYCVLKKPMIYGFLLFLPIGILLKSLQDNFALFPFDVTKGADIVNTPFMKAAVYKPELGEGYVAILDNQVPIPYHNSKQVLIRVEAAAVNPVDYKVNTALIPFVRFFLRKIPGIDVSGIVISVGDDESCKDFQKYDAVFGAAPGSLAQYTILSCNQMAKLPKRLSHNEAAALPVAFLTSLEAFHLAGFSYFSAKIEQFTGHRNKFQQRKVLGTVSSNFSQEFFERYEDGINIFFDNQDKNLLVVGGSGGCGLFGIKLGKLFGFKEIISINSPKNNAVVKKHGATKVVNYRDETELSEFIQQYQGKVDFVYDTVTEHTSEYDYFNKLSGILSEENSKYVAINGRGHNFLWYGILKPSIRAMLDSLELSLGSTGQYNFADTLLPEEQYNLFVLTGRKALFDETKAIFELPDSERFLKEIEISTIIKLENTADVVSAYVKLKTQRTVGKIVVLPMA